MTLIAEGGRSLPPPTSFMHYGQYCLLYTYLPEGDLSATDTHTIMVTSQSYATQSGAGGEQPVS